MTELEPTVLTARNPVLADILDVDLLDAMIAGGYVRTQRHPELPFTIYNYTEAAQYGRIWNPVTMACRGLICDSGTGAVLARPFAKFFNHGDPQSALIELDEPVTVTEKLDGSLGVLYPTADGWAMATRGSFASTQAQHATRVFRERYADRFTPPSGLTPLFEIVYPANRIVVDYGDLDDLVLLGAVEIATGRSHGPSAVPSWPGPVTEIFPFRTFAEALAAPPRAGREGLVVHGLTSDLRIKIKYAEYVALHRLVTGLNARTVWEYVVAGRDLAELIEPLPDEFHQWVLDVAAELTATVERQLAEIDQAYAQIIATLPEGFSRRDFAAVATRHPFAWGLFRRLDGADPRPDLLKRARPEIAALPE